MAGFDFTAAQFAGLVEQFPSMNVDKTVCYKDFCDEVGPVYCKTSCLCVQLCVCVCVCVYSCCEGAFTSVCVCTAVVNAVTHSARKRLVCSSKAPGFNP
jgi:hypothetical protein